MTEMKKILIVDAFPDATNELLNESIGEKSFGEINGAILDELCNGAIEWDVVYSLKQAPDVSVPAAYDGSIWTGSSLSAIDDSDEVRRMADWMSACVESGKPIFGICFGLQIAAKIGGGIVETNPLGIETLVGREVTPSPAAKDHPMMRQRCSGYDVLADHVDNIVSLPAGGTILAGNLMSNIQAAAFEINGTPIWGVQYHPDMDPRFIRLLLIYRREQLISEGKFKDSKEFETYLGAVEKILENPDDADLAQHLGFSNDVMQTEPRVAELQCWIENQVS